METPLEEHQINLVNQTVFDIEGTIYISNSTISFRNVFNILRSAEQLIYFFPETRPAGSLFNIEQVLLSIVGKFDCYQQIQEFSRNFHRNSVDVSLLLNIQMGADREIHENRRRLLLCLYYDDIKHSTVLLLSRCIVFFIFAFFLFRLKVTNYKLK